MTPLSYSQRTAVIQIGFSQSLEGAESAVYIQTGVPNPTSFSTYATRSVYSSVSIPVIPAPACTVVLGLGACIAARRKRG